MMSKEINIKRECKEEKRKKIKKNRNNMTKNNKITNRIVEK